MGKQSFQSTSPVRPAIAAKGNFEQALRRLKRFYDRYEYMFYEDNGRSSTRYWDDFGA